LAGSEDGSAVGRVFAATLVRAGIEVANLAERRGFLAPSTKKWLVGIWHSTEGELCRFPTFYASRSSADCLSR
jgi:hypothetical protein